MTRGACRALLVSVLCVGSGCIERPAAHEKVTWRAVDARFSVGPDGRSAAVPTVSIAGVRRPVMGSVGMTPFAHGIVEVRPGDERVVSVTSAEPQASKAATFATYRTLGAGEHGGALVEMARELDFDAALQRFAFLPEHPVQGVVSKASDPRRFRISLPSDVRGGALIVLYRAGEVQPQFVTDLVEIPPRSSLRFGLGMEQEDLYDAGASVRFTVRVRRGREDHTVFEEELAPAATRGNRGWSDRRVDLGPWVDEEVRLVFSTERIGDDGGARGGISSVERPHDRYDGDEA